MLLFCVYLVLFPPNHFPLHVLRFVLLASLPSQWSEVFLSPPFPSWDNRWANMSIRLLNDVFGVQLLVLMLALTTLFQLNHLASLRTLFKPYMAALKSLKLLN